MRRFVVNLRAAEKELRGRRLPEVQPQILVLEGLAVVLFSIALVAIFT